MTDKTSDDNEKNGKLAQAKGLVQDVIDTIQRAENDDFINAIGDKTPNDNRDARPEVVHSYSSSSNNDSSIKGNFSHSSMFDTSTNNQSPARNQSHNSDSDDENSMINGRLAGNINANPNSLLETPYASYGTQQP